MPLIKRVKKTVARVWRGNPPYQEKRRGGMDNRWAMISGEISAGDGTLLDLGCNVGVFTRKAAEAGLIALGIDTDAGVVKKARALHQDVPGLGFMIMNLGPREIARLPEFDVTLCLSVHHYWARLFGLEVSWEMIRTLLTHTRSKLFFEPASIRSKYKESAPDIIDLDRNSIINTNVTALRRVAPAGYTVRYLGETPCIGKEPFRLLFIAERG
ncbi:MAG: hypothetical protein C3F12_04115 [Candidatus Methylomirabilota bacterium]|nr:class I SAM-dependent methyltransferase [Candidatus Methylomirabilis sp.]NJD69616.1 class I SAM-dependent methyltransferase [candidate division NC10 bacterium]PWB47173.1 MAG: hypothetical protein C3F12_04115 [candidate division NC10 bacterium]